jgi:GTPase
MQRYFLSQLQEKFNLDPLLTGYWSFSRNPAWYDKDIFTDKNLRFFASEIIREKILINYGKEIPYCTEVVIDSFKELEGHISYRCCNLCYERFSKGILIGKGGTRS